MKEESKKKVSAISLGCDKNRVDLEKMLFALSERGYDIVDDVADANVAIVNTCAFITPAKKEALENIFQMCLRKKNGLLEKVIVSGCLSQRHKAELEKQIPEVDAFLTQSDNCRICEIVDELFGIKNDKNAKNNKKSTAKDGCLNGRIFTYRGSYAYLKIADGCSNACTFCTIPRIKGRYVSYDMDTILDEAKYLAKKNVKELVLVAQDVTRYGEDLYGENKLIELCQKLSKIQGIEWIRLHYLYPEKITDKFLDFMMQNKKMCKYLDMPLQHIDDRILSSMRRRLDEQHTRELVQKLHEKYPEIALRTTFIVGYPTETAKDFAKLCEFVKEAKFDYAGFFPYYREENTPSYFLDKQVREITKKHRLKKIQKLQNQIATEHGREKLGKQFVVLVDDFDQSKGVFVGHTEFLSQTVDFSVEIVDNGNINFGDFVNVKFVDFDGETFKSEVVETENNKKD